jgi:hypothetical protein
MNLWKESLEYMAGSAVVLLAYESTKRYIAYPRFVGVLAHVAAIGAVCLAGAWVLLAIIARG